MKGLRPCRPPKTAPTIILGQTELWGQTCDLDVESKVISRFLISTLYPIVSPEVLF